MNLQLIIYYLIIILHILINFLNHMFLLILILFLHLYHMLINNHNILYNILYIPSLFITPEQSSSNIRTNIVNYVPFKPNLTFDKNNLISSVLIYPYPSRSAALNIISGVRPIRLQLLENIPITA